MRSGVKIPREGGEVQIFILGGHMSMLSVKILAAEKGAKSPYQGLVARIIREWGARSDPVTYQ